MSLEPGAPTNRDGRSRRVHGAPGARRPARPTRRARCTGTGVLRPARPSRRAKLGLLRRLGLALGGGRACRPRSRGARAA